MSSVKRESNNVTISATHLILDIEGTTSSISFVKDVLFPYVRKHLEAYVNNNWDSADFQDLIKALRAQAKDDEENKMEGVIPIPETGEKDLLTKALIDNIIWQMNNDRKTKCLKDLQGLIMEEGYKSGDLKGHVYDDVEPNLKSWVDKEKNIYIYSSGSVHAQKLLFGHSEKGDLLPFIKGHFDTTVGMKSEMESYKKIAEEISCSPSEAAFLTDIPKEARAAKGAGMLVILVSREGNSILKDEDKADFPIITSFAEVEFEHNNKKRKICTDVDITNENKLIETNTINVKEENKTNDPKLTTDSGVEMMEVDDNTSEDTITKKGEIELKNETSCDKEVIQDTSCTKNSKTGDNEETEENGSNAREESICEEKMELPEEKLESVEDKLGPVEDKLGSVEVFIKVDEKSKDNIVAKLSSQKDDTKCNGENIENKEVQNFFHENEKEKTVTNIDCATNDAIIKKNEDGILEDSDTSLAAVKELNEQSKDQEKGSTHVDNNKFQSDTITHEINTAASAIKDDSFKPNSESAPLKTESKVVLNEECSIKVNETDVIIEDNVSEHTKKVDAKSGENFNAEKECEKLESKKTKSTTSSEVAEEVDKSRAEETVKIGSITNESDTETKLDSVSIEFKGKESEHSEFKQTVPEPQNDLSEDIKAISSTEPMEVNSETKNVSEPKHDSLPEKNSDNNSSLKETEGLIKISEESTKIESQVKQHIPDEKQENPSPKESKAANLQSEDIKEVKPNSDIQSNIICDSKERNKTETLETSQNTNKTESSETSQKIETNGTSENQIDLNKTESNVPSTEVISKEISLPQEEEQEPQKPTEISKNEKLCNSELENNLNGTSSPLNDKELSNGDVTQTTSFEGKKCDASENTSKETVVEA